MAAELSFGSVEIYHDEELGVGAYGKVCKAKCGQLPCAAKLLHSVLVSQENDRNLVKFQQECQHCTSQHCLVSGHSQGHHVRNACSLHEAHGREFD